MNTQRRERIGTQRRWAVLIGVLALLGLHTTTAAAPDAQAQTSVAAPTIDPAGGNHTDNVTVTMATETPGAEIRYTFDPLSDESTWTVYSGPIQLTPSENAQVIRARAYLDGQSSDLAQVAFNVFDSSLTGQVEVPDVIPASGTYVNPIQVTVDGHTAPPFKIRQLHITTDGMEPRPHSNTGSGVSSPSNLMVATTTTVKALATQLGWANSDVVTRVYVLQCATTAIAAADAGGDQQTITLTSETLDAKIRYTTDGSDPTETSELYVAPFDVGTDVYEINARCFRSGFEPSPISTLEVNDPPPPVFCMGLEVTVDLSAQPPEAPTEGPDVILGTEQADTIDALGGDDVICAGDGNDVIMAGDGNDEVDGGAGDDTIDGGNGDDVIMAGDGDDAVEGSAGNDTVMGGLGADSLRGGDGNDVLRGEAGNDVVRGGPGVDTVDGGDGDDRVLGGIGDDTLIGGPGNDYLGGFGGADTISGGPGNETIYGGFGADTIDGGDGNDTVFGLIGDDIINGGNGNDILNGDRGNDTINGGDGDDVVNGGNANDVLHGDSGNDTVNGGKADDQLFGDAGSDACSGNKQHVADVADASCEQIFGVP